MGFDSKHKFAPPTIFLGFLVAQMVKFCLQCLRPGFNPWVGKNPWRRNWHPTPILLPGKSHGQRSLVGYSPWGRKESDTTGQIYLLTILLELLCPWTWAISSQLLQCLSSYWGFSDLGRGVSPHGWSIEAQLLLLTLDVGFRQIKSAMTCHCTPIVVTIIATGILIHS